jgi:hypothetical protein
MKNSIKKTIFLSLTACGWLLSSNISSKASALLRDLYHQGPKIVRIVGLYPKPATASFSRTPRQASLLTLEEIEKAKTNCAPTIGLAQENAGFSAHMITTYAEKLTKNPSLEEREIKSLMRKFDRELPNYKYLIAESGLSSSSNALIQDSIKGMNDIIEHFMEDANAKLPN